MKTKLRRAKSDTRLSGEIKETVLETTYNSEQLIKNENDEKGMTPTVDRITWTARSSRLDPHNLNSDISRSGMNGWLNLFLVSAIVWVISQNLSSLRNKQTIIGIESLLHIVGRIDLLPAWLTFSTASFSVVVLQKCIVSGLLSPFSKSTKFLHYSLLLTFFGLGNFVLLNRDWPFIQTTFFLLEIMIFLAKMHSYLICYRDFALLSVTQKYLPSSPAENKHTNEEILKKPSSILSENPKKKGSHSPSYSSSSSTPIKITYPRLPTFSNFLWFLVAPPLVYEFEYPQTEKINWSYFFEKVLSFIGVVTFLHVIVDVYITPVLAILHKISLLDAVAELIIPFMFCQILIFYLMFDIVCNAVAEITKFADREFYTDWWNSTSFDEYARRWNKPVHMWLMKHVYSPAMKDLRLKKWTAMILTFLFSSIFHEYAMSLSFKFFKPYLFALQMGQIPLILIGRPLKGTKVGNVFFWISMLWGVPFLSVLYCREWAYSEGAIVVAL